VSKTPQGNTSTIVGTFVGIFKDQQAGIHIPWGFKCLM
jgi:hypothetical protein